MTECERIIKEGILPETFFKPETICDFYVDEMRKKIWAIEIDLYLELEKVCKKHNLRFYTIGGLYWVPFVIMALYLGMTIWMFVCQEKIMKNYAIYV